MYDDFFHLSEPPFSIAPDPHFMFMSTRHQEGLAHLLYGIRQTGGFVALTGEVGTGKTTLCRCLLEQLPQNIDVALVLNPKLNALELLASLCDELRIEYDAGKYSLKNLVDALNRYLLTAHARNRRTVLIIDEAQNLTLEVLEQIRLLTNLETSKTKLLQIILVGQPELNELLSRRELRQLNQRITARYHLLPLSFEETRIYIRHRLTVCKGDPGIFKDNAVKRIYARSGGIPRVINIICHCALLGAYATDSRFVTPAIVDRAAEETLGRNLPSSHSFMPVLAVLSAVLLIGAGALQSPAVERWLGRSSTVSPVTSSLAINTHSAERPTLKPVDTKQPATSDSENFGAKLNNANHDLSSALSNLLVVWGKKLPSETSPDCKTVQELGLLCISAKGNWKDLITYNRPVIMEFAMADESKRFALVKRIDKGRLVIRFEQDRSYLLSDVLSDWDGNYVLLWQPPFPQSIAIYPGQSSANVEWLREKITKIDGLQRLPRNPQFFDADLKARVIKFQKTNRLLPDGIVGMQTLFYLDNATGAEHSPHLMD